MQTLNPKIVFFDIDDTLYRKATDTLRPSVTQAIKALKTRGIITAIATGRTSAAFPAKIQQLITDTEMDMLVIINGQYIHYRGQTLKHFPMPSEKIQHMVNSFEHHHIPYAFVSEETIAASERSDLVDSAMNTILPNYSVDPEYFHKHDVYQILGFYNQSHDQTIALDVQNQGLKTIRWHKNSVDLLEQQGSKARGIQIAINELGIDMKDVMAFGDGLNDLEMIQTVGFGVAMGNGVPELKALANYVAPSVEEDGVYHALQDLGVIN